MKLWVVWYCAADDAPCLLGITRTVNDGKRLADDDNADSLDWHLRPDGRYTGGAIDYPDYQVQPFEVPDAA